MFRVGTPYTIIFDNLKQQCIVDRPTISGLVHDTWSIFYRELYQNKFRGDDTKIFQIFGVPISNAKITIKVQFRLVAPVMKYHQNTYNSCCLSSLALSFHCINYNRAKLALVNSIE